MSRLRSVLTLGIAGTAALAAAVIAPAASASADEGTAVVRSAHFSPDTAGVDVYLAPFSGGQTQLWVSDESYGTVSQYRHITPGAYVVSMRPHGAAATTAPTISWTLDATSGSAYTAAAIGKKAALQAVVLTDDLTSPAAGTGRVRIVQAASAAPSVSVQANGGVALADKLAFGSTSKYAQVPTGAWDVRATADSGSVSPATASVAIAAGSSNTVVVLDKTGGGLNLISLQDAGSAAVAPTGPVDAGAGGTATQFAVDPTPSTPWGVWTGAGLAALLGLAFIGLRVGRRVQGR